MKQELGIETNKKGKGNKTLKIELPYDSAIALLRIYLKECKPVYSKGTCTPMFIAAPFTITKLRKQP
jgi:hypothetical protein